LTTYLKEKKMPSGRTTPQPEDRVDETPAVQNGRHVVAPKPREESPVPKFARKRKPRRKFTWPKFSLKQRRASTPTENSPTNGHVEISSPEATVTDADLPQTGNGVINFPAVPETDKPKRKKKRALPRKWIRPRRPPGEKKEKDKKLKPAAQIKRGRRVKWLLLFLICLVFPLGTVMARVALHKVGTEEQARQAADRQINDQLKVVGATSEFPLANAVATANRMAYECFTVPNYGANPEKGDMVSFQNKALANAAIPAGDKVNCGWDGKGRGKIDSVQVVPDQYWVHADRATVVLQLKLYQRPGFIYYFVPFRNNNGIAQVAGMPAIFGTSSGAQDFLPTCEDPVDSVNTDEMRHTSQLFMDGLAGNATIDLEYLTYMGAKFSGFGPAVSSPKITQLKYCGKKGNEKYFAAMVRFNGPVAGAHYTLPYGFGVVPNPETSGKYQVKNFGPTPGYMGD
jgi:hypothetical protein